MEKPKLVHLKKELAVSSRDELLEICLRLAKHKVENKEFLHYLLFDAKNETIFVAEVQNHITTQFAEINNTNYYWMRKSIRKILKETKKYIRFSKSKSTEIELLLHFLAEMLKLKPNILKDKRLSNLYERNLLMLDKKINAVHEDLQYDYHLKREAL